MKALVFFSPVTDRMNSETFMKELKKFRDDAFGELEKALKSNEKASHSKILLLPVYITGIQFLKGSAEITSIMLMDKENASWRENRFAYFQFKDGEYIKVSGDIVSLDIDKKPGEDGVAESITKYGEMGASEKKRFRQKAGKKLIQYLSNLTVINQMNNWASVNDTAEGKENIGNREPSTPINVYSKVTKNMWIVYFNEMDPLLDEKNAKNWDEISDADREYRYQETNKRLEALDTQINALDDNIKKELDDIETRRVTKQKMLAVYGDENSMKLRLNSIKEEKEKIATTKTREEAKKTALPSSATDLEKKMIDLEIDRLNSQNAMLAAEDEEIRDALENDVLDKTSLEKMKRWKEEQKKLIESRKEVKKSQVKSKSEYEVELEMEKRKHWAESLIGIKEGIPLRYMYVPEVEIVSYSEVAELGEKAGGKFEIIVKQVIRDGKYATVGDPISLGMRGIGRIADKIGKIIGVGRGTNVKTDKF